MNSQRRFAQDASIVLIGMNGVGKSSLGIMASASLTRKFVDVEQLVNYSTLNRNQQYETIRDKLNAFDKNSVIVLPASFIDNKSVLKYLQTYSIHHPVIHVTCEQERIVQYFDHLGLHKDYGKLKKFLKFLAVRNELYTSCSNFDFFNRNSIKNNQFNNRAEPNKTSSVLALKLCEQEFLKFLDFILIGRHKTNLNVQVNPEQTSHSTCLQVKYPDELSEHIDMTDVDSGTDCIEVRLDIEKFRDQKLQTAHFHEFISKIRRFTESDVPIMLTIDGTIPEIINNKEYLDLYVELLYQSFRLGLEYVSLNIEFLLLEVDDQIFQRWKSLASLNGFTKVIGTYVCHEQDDGFWTSKLPREICSFSEKLECPIIRISKTFTSAESENIEAISFAQGYSKENKDILISVFNGGRLGKISKLLNPIMTPVISRPAEEYSSVNQFYTLNPTPIEKLLENSFTVDGFQKALHDCHLSPQLKFFVFGSNVFKSLSPAIHNAAYRHLGLLHQFEIFESSNIEDLKSLMKSSNFGGTAILMPFKLKAMEFVDEISPEAEIIGALNTVLPIRPKNDPFIISRTCGFNTDWIGIKSNIISNISPINSVTKKTTALVLGSGGMARATIYALITLKVEKILIWNRTIENAESLADFYNKKSPLLIEGRPIDFKVHVLDDLSIENKPEDWNPPTIIVSCVPGMDPNTREPVNFEFPSPWFENQTGGVALDTGYNPLMTKLVVKAKALRDRGWVAAHGLNYLHGQAMTQFQLFTGKIPPRNLMEQTLFKSYVAYMNEL